MVDLSGVANGYMRVVPLKTSAKLPVILHQCAGLVYNNFQLLVFPHQDGMLNQDGVRPGLLFLDGYAGYALERNNHEVRGYGIYIYRSLRFALFMVAIHASRNSCNNS
jgi:hypothetical protein